MAKKKTLDVPPFPPLTWDGYGWEGEITLPSWAGFQTRGGAYGGRSSKKPSDGTGSDDELLKSSEQKYVSDWSPDSRFLLFAAGLAPRRRGEEVHALWRERGLAIRGAGVLNGGRRGRRAPERH